MVLKLYTNQHSPSAKFVVFTAKALGITLEIIELDFSKHDHLKPEYLQLNPQHTVPTLDDDGKILWDSHAISVYLATKYGKDDSLYPKDPYKRAVINQRLHFNSGMLFYYRKEIFKRVFQTGKYELPPEYVEGIQEAYGYLENFLENHKWVAGDELTLADLCLIPTVTYNDTIVPIDQSKFPKISAWIKLAEALPYYSIHKESLDYVRKMAVKFCGS